jgi:hypothetical protein
MIALGVKFSKEVNCKIAPDPLANTPVAVLSLVQKNAVPEALSGLTNVVVGTDSLGYREVKILFSSGGKYPYFFARTKNGFF